MARQEQIRDIVIVGGGSAGWLTAGLIAGEHRAAAGSSLQVTLIESPEVPTVGVGEGTWPTMRSTLQRIGISETQFLIECAASFKQGTRFEGWRSGGKDDRYYHPFTPPAGYATMNLVPHWLADGGALSFVDAVSTQGRICDHNLAPKQSNTPEYAAVLNYGYHLDAGRFADLLQRHCTGKLGVRHVQDRVLLVHGGPDEDIRSLATAQHGEIAGDLFVDCTGMGALLLGRHYGIPFIDRSNVLFNDTALALQLPYDSESEPVASQTIAAAQPAGWIWDIGLSSRRGVGYTYSSAHSREPEPERILREYIERTTRIAAGELEPRLIRFQPGHRTRFWHRNCVAIGMAAGFIEPLEASALVLIELSGRMIADELPATREIMDVVARRYNETFRYRWDRIIDFLKLHYVLSRRSDTAYWTDHRLPESIPTSLQERLAEWRYRGPWHGDFPQRDEIFSSASYQYVLYGMGFETEFPQTQRRANGAERAQELFEENERLAEQQLGNLPGNRDILTHIGQCGLPSR